MGYYSGLRNGSTNNLIFLGPFRDSTYGRFHFMANAGDDSANAYDRIFGSGTTMIIGGTYKAT